MRNLFFGNKRDFYKYALLRVLSACVNSIGICWLLTEHSRIKVGARDYLRSVGYGDKDSVLVEKLLECVREEDAKKRQRDVRSVEEKEIIPKAKYFYDSFSEEGGRDCYFKKAAEKFRDCDLIFFDPNVGVMPAKVSKGNHESEYIREYEIRRIWQEWKNSSLVIFQYFFSSFESKHSKAVHGRVMDQLRRAGQDADIFCIRCRPVAYYFMLRKKRKGIVCRKMDKIRELGFSDPMQ